MPLRKKCEDPLVVAVRELYDMQPLVVPRGDVQPLCLIASDGETSKFLGPIQPLVKGNDPIAVRPSRVGGANALLEQSRAVGFDVGLKLLDGFLAAWGIPSASISANFHGATKVSFRFTDVSRVSVSPTDLSRAIQNRTIDVASPLTSVFFGPKALGFFVIDAIVTSRDFTMRLEDTATAGGGVSLPAIQALVGKVTTNVTVEQHDLREVTFKGDNELPFAFSCVRFSVSARGTVTAITPGSTIPPFRFSPGAAPSSTTRVLLTDEPGLFEFD